MHLCIQAVRHVGSDCRHGCLAVLQSRCKTFISPDYLQSSVMRAESLFQREIGDRSRLLGMLLVMRSLEILPFRPLFISSSFRLLTSPSVFNLCYPNCPCSVLFADLCIPHLFSNQASCFSLCFQMKRKLFQLLCFCLLCVHPPLIPTHSKQLL